MVWPDTLFWLLWGLRVVILCVCCCVMYARHNLSTVGFFSVCLKFLLVVFGEINVVLCAAVFC